MTRKESQHNFETPLNLILQTFILGYYDFALNYIRLQMHTANVHMKWKLRVIKSQDL